MAKSQIGTLMFTDDVNCAYIINFNFLCFRRYHQTRNNPYKNREMTKSLKPQHQTWWRIIFSVNHQNLHLYY